MTPESQAFQMGMCGCPRGHTQGLNEVPCWGVGGYDKQLLESYLIIFGLVSKSYVVLFDFFSFF